MKSLRLIQLLKIGAACAACLVFVVPVVTASMNATAASSPPAPAAPPASMKGLPDYISHPAAGSAEIDKLARKSHGDITRLTMEEQTFLDSVTANHASAMLLKRAQDLHVLGTH